MSASSRVFRKDIEGLRAVAVILIVGYHAAVPGFDVGFVGVDIFFVLSGYLITRLLLEEIVSTGTVDLRGFWARRARRLLPAITLVLVVTGIAATVFFTGADARRTATDIGATAVYASNLIFVRRGTDYFAGGAPSPLLHTWSLAAEEQLYVLWPIVLCAVAGLFRGDPSRRMRALGCALLGMTVSSFIGSMLLWNTPRAFYGTLSRAWEFGLGGCIALASVAFARTSRPTGAILATGGAAALLAAVLVIDEHRVYPGLAVLWPTLGTAGLIAGGTLSTGSYPVRLLSTKPLQWIGRLSYSLYLWHWPVIIFAGQAGDLTRLRLALAVFLAVVLSVVTYVVVENPIRWHPRLTRSPNRTLALGAGLTVVSISVSLALLTHSALRLRDPYVRSLEDAGRDIPTVSLGACRTPEISVLDRECAFGSPDGPLMVMLVGDSHAHQWLPALDRIGRRRGWRGIVYGRSNCPPADVNIPSNVGCRNWQSELVPLVRHVRPGLLILSSASTYPALGWIHSGSGHHLAHAEQIAEWQAGIERTVAAVHPYAAKVMWIQGTPRFPVSPLTCLEKSRDSASCMATERDATAFTRAGRLAEAAAFEHLKTAGLIDPVALLCESSHCPVVQNEIIVYRDTNHVTATFARNASTDLERMLFPAREPVVR